MTVAIFPRNLTPSRKACDTSAGMSAAQPGMPAAGPETKAVELFFDEVERRSLVRLSLASDANNNDPQGDR